MPSTFPAAATAAPILGHWGRPPDGPAQAALGVALALLAVAVTPRGLAWLRSVVDVSSVADLERPRRFLTVAAFVAAFLSLGYIGVYLRGGPRAPDASAHWLAGRALSHGMWAWSAPHPVASFRASDLWFRQPDRLSSIVPPGYPLLLAAGFIVGAPMLVGPLIAAALVVATWLLALEVAGDRVPAPQAEAIARLAVGLSIVSAALRYHTAEALPYGTTALALTSSFAFALRARRSGDVRWFAASGFSLGLLIASRPVSALSLGATLAVLVCRAQTHRAKARAFVLTCAGVVPGFALLLLANRAATGHPWTSSSASYFAALGHPSQAEHSWLRAVWAMRAVAQHLVDVDNLEPLALLAIVPLFGGPVPRNAVLSALLIAGYAVAEAAIQGDGPRPDGGARALVAVLPLEHVLVAFAVARVFPRGFASAGVATLALAILGFAVHASFAHAANAASGDGRPAFEPDVLHEANVTHGLLFFGDDAGYELEHDPGVGASHGIEAVRMRGDDHDRLIYDSLGHPPAYRYVADAHRPSIVAWKPPNALAEGWRFEAESDWAPLALGGGVADVVAPSDPCVSQGHVLRLSPVVGRGETVMLALPLPPVTSAGSAKGRWIVTPRVVQRAGAGRGLLTLVTELGQAPLAEWKWADSARSIACVDLPGRVVELSGDLAEAWLVAEAQGGEVMLDRTMLRRL